MRIALIAALLFGAGQAAAQPYAYVTNSGSGTVSVIDTATETVIDTIPVGNQPWGAELSPDGQFFIASNLSDGTLSIIDTTTRATVATVPVGPSGNPYITSFQPDGQRAYVGGFTDGTISVVDMASFTVVDTIAGIETGIYSPVVSSDGTTLYIASFSTGNVSIIDLVTGSLTTTLPTAHTQATFVVLSPDDSRLYVGSQTAGVMVIDTATQAVVGTVPTGGSPGIVLSNDGSRLYTANWQTNVVHEVDTATLTITDTIPVGDSPWGIDLSSDETRLYVTNLGSNNVSVINTATNTVVNTIAVGISPYSSGNFLSPRSFLPSSMNQGVQLDAVPGAPVVYAEEIIASPGSPVTLLNPAGDLNLSANLGYSFSIGEVRYARFECDNGLRFAVGSSATYDGAGSAGLGAINGLGGSAMHFSITANDNNVTADDRLVIDGDRQIVGVEDVNCTYSLYDFPSQAAAGGPNGRVYTVSGPYVRFAPSYALEVDAEGNPVANVESTDPAFSEFTNAAPTNNVSLGRIGGFSYGEVQDVTGAVQPLTPAGPAITLADLMDAGTALIFAGDFSAASDVFFSPLADCSVNIQSADDFSELEAVFTIGNAATLAHQLCFATDGVAIPVSEYTVALDAVPAQPAVYAVTDLGPLALGAITRNGTELQAPLAQVPGGWISRMVLTNTGSQDRSYTVRVFGEDGTTIATANLTGSVPANGTKVVDLTTVLTGFTGGLPRATLNVTVAGPNNQIQGLYQIVNQGSGSISNHVMVRPGTN